MNPTFLISTLAIAACCAAPAQTRDDSRPAESNVPGAEYPRVHSDLRVTFRVTAPGARTVQVVPGGNDNGLGLKPFDMVRDENGVWTVTTPPAAPGFHYYWLMVDGFACNDPATRTYFGWGKESSGIEIPDSSVDFYDLKDVPHGEVRERWYFSKVTGLWRRAVVYTPPGYDAGGKTGYPVLYLQHGAGESERSWTAQGRANFILDNLIAARKARPMIVVMENGMYAPRPGAHAAGRPNEAFADLVVRDLVPMIDEAYRTLAGSRNRAIAGLSMGAGHALQIGLTNLDKFAYIGSFSGGGLQNLDLQNAYQGAFRDPAAFKKSVRLLWVGAGTAEGNRVLSGKASVAALNKAGIPAVWFEAPGIAHEWQTWRKCLHDFAPRLFQ